MPWIILLVAGLFEIGWAIGLKFTDGFTRLWPSLGTGASMIVSVALLAMAMKQIPVGTAYAVWTGIGAVGTATISMFLFNEPKDFARIMCLTLIVIGIVGLKVFSKS